MLRQEQEQEKRSQEQLKEEILSVQSEVREFIRNEDQFTVYQHFVNEEELDDYLQELQNLSSKEMFDLNGNECLR